MKNFIAIESKAIVSGIKTAMGAVITTKAQLAKARQNLLEAVASAVPSAVFHASNAEGAAGNLTALQSLVVACNETEHPKEAFAALKKAVFKSIHGLKLTENGEAFEFKLKGAAGKKKRNLIEGFDKVDMLEFYTPPEKQEKSKTTAVKFATEKTLNGFIKKLQHDETQDDVILQSFMSVAVEIKNRHGLGVFSDETMKSLIDAMAAHIEGESVKPAGKPHYSADSTTLTDNEAGAADMRGDEDAMAS